MHLDLAERLKRWRRANLIKQSHLASSLGVSQQAVSAWERGDYLPSQAILGRLRTMMSSADPLKLDKIFLRNQSSIRSLIDTDGARLIEVSRGFEDLWNEFSVLKGKFLEEFLINEILLLTNHDFRLPILRGDIALISGVSERHLDIDMGPAFLHRWHICFRRYGHRVIAEMVFELADAGLAKGIEGIVRVDELAL